MPSGQRFARLLRLMCGSRATARLFQQRALGAVAADEHGHVGVTRAQLGQDQAQQVDTLERHGGATQSYVKGGSRGEGSMPWQGTKGRPSQPPHSEGACRG
jgi:hypothetical protein